MSKCHLWKRRPPSKPVREQQPRYSPVMRLTANFAVPASKMKNQPAARAWNRKNLRLCVDWLLGIHGSRNINSATLACRAPLLTRVLNVVTASSPAVSVQSVSSANCMQKDEEPFNCSNQCWEILRQHVKGGRGRKKSPLGMKEAKESSPDIAVFSLQDQQVHRLFFLNCFQCRDQIVPFTPTLSKVIVGLMCALPSWGALWCFWSFVIWSHDPTGGHRWETTGIEVFWLNCVLAILQEHPLSLKCVYAVFVFLWIVARFLCYMVNMCEMWVSPEGGVLSTPVKKYSTVKKLPEGMR